MVLPDPFVVMALLAAPVAQSDRPPHELRVEVVDAAGRSVAGVPVGYGQPGGFLDSPHSRAKSDEHGIAVLPESTPFEFRLYPHDVGFRFADLEEVRVPVAADARLESPIRLVLPPTRRVEVELVDDEGRLVDGLGTIGLHLVETSADGSERGSSASWATIDAGRAVFPWIGRAGRLGFTGQVGSRWIEALEGDDRKRGRVEILGSDASTTRVRVTAGPAGSTIRGDLQRPDGSPAADTTVDVYKSFFGGPCRDRSGPEPPFDRIRTDGRGRFRVQVPRVAEQAWAVLAIPDDFGGVAAAVAIDLGGSGRYGQGFSGLDVGEQRLVEATLLAAGRVVDERGRPFGGVQLRAVPPRSSRESLATSDRVEYQRLFALWERPQATAVRGDGAFEFRSFGPIEPGDVGFSVSSPGIAEARCDPPFALPTVALGTRDVVLQLHRTGSVATAIELPAGVKATSVSSRCVQPGRPAPTDRRNLPIPFADEVVHDWLVPGRIDLVLFAAAALPNGSELLRIPDLEVKSGESCEDPRLRSIDLTTSMSVHDLRIVGPDGRYVNSGTVYGEAFDRRRSPPAEFPVELGHCRIPIVRGLESKAVVEIVAPGFAAKVVRADELDREIELAPAMVLALQVLPWPLACPVDAVLTQSTRDDAPSDHVARELTVAMPFWNGDTTEIALPRAGSWRVKLVARLDSGGRSGSRDVQVTNPLIHVEAGPQRVEAWVRVQPQGVAEIERMAGR